MLLLARQLFDGLYNKLTVGHMTLELWLHIIKFISNLTQKIVLKSIVHIQI